MRIHGRAGVVYMSVHNGDAASPLAFLSDWSVDVTRQVFDTTSLLDTQIIYVAGLPDFSGTFNGWFDTATAQTYLAAIDGLPRTMYLYPVASDKANFFSGPILPDYAIGGGISTAVSLKVTWSATGQVTRTLTIVGSAFAGLATGTGTAPQASVSLPVNAPAQLATAAGVAQPPALTTPGFGFTSIPGKAIPGYDTPGSPGTVATTSVYTSTYTSTY